MGAHRTRVKVCGLTSATDAEVAVRAGADAVGVVLADSPRRVTPAEAAVVLEPVPPSVLRVGVFVDPALDEVVEAVRVAGLTAVQLHGGETPAFCVDVHEATGVAVIKAFRVGAGYAPEDVEPYRGGVEAVLLDTYVKGTAGGTGETFAWDPALLPDGVPVWLAGGLAPANAAEAVRAMHPYGVDVSSGVEARMRVKDPARVEAFVAAVRAVDEEQEPS